MPVDPRDSLNLVVGASVFGLVLAVWLIFLLAWYRRRSSRAQKVERRLRLGGENDTEAHTIRLWREEERGVGAATLKAGRRRSLARLLSDAGWQLGVSQLVIRLLGIMALVGGATFFWTGNLLAPTAIGGLVIIVFWMYLMHRIAQRASLFERQFLEALNVASRSLRVGHPLVGAFHLISEEFPDPVGPVFAEICQQHELGSGLDVALRRAAETSPSTDMKLFATSVAIQMRTGGNLADMMERVAHVIRDRMRLGRRIRVLTAQTQLSKRILIALPFVIFLVLFLINPTYMTPLFTHWVRQAMLTIGAVSLMLGALIMNRLAVLRY